MDVLFSTSNPHSTRLAAGASQSTSIRETVCVTSGRVQAPVEEVGERPLVAVALVDVGDAELRLPVEGVGGPLEHLLLLGHRLKHRLLRRPL